jgi:hypothetical protein
MVMTQIHVKVLTAGQQQGHQGCGLIGCIVLGVAEDFLELVEQGE